MSICFAGRAYCVAGTIDVDWDISPIDDLQFMQGPGLALSYPEKLKYLSRNCFKARDPQFHEKVSPGDILVGGKGVGWGHDHDHAVMALKGSGIAAVVCESTRQNFQRNCIHHGMPLVTIENIFQETDSGDQIEILLDIGILKNHSTSKEYKFRPYPGFLLDIIGAGGLYTASSGSAATIA